MARNPASRGVPALQEVAWSPQSREKHSSSPRGERGPASIRLRNVLPSTALSLVLLLAFCLCGCSSQETEYRTCVRVVDGDTIILDGRERVRLVGVDTPETKDPRKPVQYFGKEASLFTERLVEGRRVRLEYDHTRRDRYGRTLAYVFLENGTFVNLEIVRQGYGHAYTKYPFRRMDEFRRAETTAREAGKGLWATN